MRALAALVVGVGLAGACTEGARPDLDDTAQASSTSSAPTASSTTTTSTTTTSTTTTVAVIASPNGRLYPSVPATADDTIARLIEVELLVRDTDPADPGFADLAHEQQMLYRWMGRNPDWIPALLEAVPDEIATIVQRHVAARRAIADIGSGEYEPPTNVPAWEIIDPLPAEELRTLYERAAADIGIEWQFLAAINFIETGFGRIDGLSTAGAQGPMQFLPTTWEEVSDGDIDDPYDAIPAAARYLVRRGGPDDMHRALWGYNNSDAYVAAVTHYANLFRDDERSFLAAHAWEIHYSAADGDLWFPIGYRQEEAMPVADYLAEAPWSAPPPPT